MQCATAQQLEQLHICKLEEERLTEELLHSRRVAIHIESLKINMGSVWSFTNATYNGIATVVKIENHLGVGCNGCKKGLKRLKMTIQQILMTQGDTTTQCTSVRDLEECQRDIQQLNVELVSTRNNSINVQNVSISGGSRWSFRNSTYNSSITTIKVENKGNVCKECAKGFEELELKLHALLKILQANNTSSCTPTDPTTIQYQPSSCKDLAKLNPDSPSGYYWIHERDKSLRQVHCLFAEPTEDDPAMSCKQIHEQFPLSPPGYYWLRSSDGTAVQVFCETY